MLTDEEIDQAASQLAQHRQTDALSQILDSYEALLLDHRRLKSDYEEERNAREKYKQMARSQERNPFVLVLVDADGYVFRDDLISKGADGGSAAAQVLDGAIKASLQRKGLDHCQIMVRLYANVVGLSKTLCKAGLSGPEKRSLAPFIASFNRSYGLADFVDAGELKENADSKLRALVRLHADNSQCKHIYFAACHDVGYISDLTQFAMNSPKFTLINSPGIKFHPEFTKLNMAVEELPGVFRTTPLDTALPHRSPYMGLAVPKPTPGPIPLPSSRQPPSLDRQKPLCKFYPQRNCKFGKACKNLHVDDGATTNTPRGSWRSNAPSDTNGSLYGGDEITPRGYTNTTNTKTPAISCAEFSKLPKKESMPPGHVAVNDNNFRLDIYISPPSPETSQRFQAQIKKRPVCNKLHMTGFCNAGGRCAYDHDPLDTKFKQALELLARSMPCPQHGRCRSGTCTKGHICQNADCKYYGGKAYCKLPYASHDQNLAVARYVAATSTAPYDLSSPEESNQGSSLNGEDFRTTSVGTTSLGSPPILDEDEQSETPERKMSFGGVEDGLRVENLINSSDDRVSAVESFKIMTF